MILMNDFKAEPEALLQSELKAVERVLRSGWYILGNELEAFEKKWAAACGAESAIGVGNGMDAIEIGLRALDIGPGDEVITTSMTAFATVLAIIRAGATPVLADTDPGTALLSRDSVARCLTTKTKAVLLVHLYGQVKDMESWQTFCRDHKIYLLEDCAQAHLAEWNGKIAGTFGQFGAYSFYPTKNLGAIGDGGALITNHGQLAERSKILRNYGQLKRYIHSELGLNSRLDELQAAILVERMAWLDEFTKSRQRVAAMYRSGITNERIGLLDAPLQPRSHSYHLFVVVSDAREKLAQFMTEAGIANLSHYPIPVHQQKPCLELRMDTKGLEASELHATQCLSIPCHPQLNDQQVRQIIDVLNAF